VINISRGPTLRGKDICHRLGKFGRTDRGIIIIRLGYIEAPQEGPIGINRIREVISEKPDYLIKIITVFLTHLD